MGLNYADTGTQIRGARADGLDRRIGISMEKARNMRSRAIFRNLMLAAAFVWMAAASAAGADADSAIDIIEPHLPRAQFARLMQRLGIDDDQELIAEMLYSDYAAALVELAERIDQRADDAGRQRVEDALSGKIFVEAGELRRLRVAVLEAYRSGWDETDDLLEELMMGVVSLLTTDATDEFDAAMREQRRALYLHPRAASEQDETYAGDGVDVIELFARATVIGGELFGIDPDSVAAVFGGYEREIDLALAASGSADRQGRTNRAIARIEKDTSAMRREERAALDRWQRIYQLNQRTVSEIGQAAAEELGTSAQRAWLNRFEHACFPWLFRDTTPAKQREWITVRKVSDEVLHKADEVYAGYREEHAALCREAVGVILRGRLNLKTMLSSRMDPSQLQESKAHELYQELLKNSGKRAKLDSDASAKLEALLSDSQRRQMRADIAASAYGRRRR